MAKKTEHISTSEFSSLSGLSVSQVSKLLREGKIKGVKESGKWMISRSQLKLKAVQEMVKSKNPAPCHSHFEWGWRPVGKTLACDSSPLV